MERSKERCAFNNISCDNETFLLVAAFYTPVSTFGKDPFKIRPSEQFFYTFIQNKFEPLRKHIFLDVKVNTLYFWSRDGIQIFTIDLVLDLLIGQHLILFLPQNFFFEISRDFIFVLPNKNTFSGFLINYSKNMEP